MSDIVERVGRLPGVIAASAVGGGMPMGSSSQTSSFTIPGRTDLTANKSIKNVRVTPDYAKALGIPITRGRFFSPNDRDGAPPVLIINESAARQFFPGEDPIGKTVNLGSDRVIVGVVGDVYQRNLETAPQAEAYVPVAQAPIFSADLIVRTSGDPTLAVPGVRAAVLAVLPDVPLRSVRTMEEIIGRQIAQRRFNMLMLGLFGLLGLVISAVGIYGVMAYLVAQREREIGVRMALGATRRSVVGMVLRTASMLVVAGLVIGSVAAWLLSGTAETFLFRMDVNDPRAFVTAIAALAIAAIVASVVPARRAASVDPIVALRSE
jgi:predicted permease